MHYLSIFFVSFIIAFSGALMPGPLLTAVISESMKHGQKTGPLVILGHAILEVVMITLILFSLHQLSYSFMLMKMIALVGACMLLYNGIAMMVSVRDLKLEFKADATASRGLVLTGITMSLSNPYWMVWWLTIGLGLVLAAQQAGLAAIGIFFLGHISADFIWYTAISMMVSRGRNYLSQNVYRSIIFICGLAIVAFGLYFGTASFN